MNIMKQFVLGRRLMSDWALKHHAGLNDSQAARLATWLAEQDWNAARQADDRDLSLLSFLALESANRYYVQSDRALKTCQTHPEAHPLSDLVPTLQAMVAAFRFYDSVRGIQANLPENELESIQVLSNRLFAIIAVHFPEHMQAVHSYAMSDAVLAALTQAGYIPNTDYEPIYSPTHQQFVTAVDKTRCIFAPSGKYWGAREFDPAVGIEDNIRRFGEDLFRFMTVAKKEKFKGLAFRMPALYSQSVDGLAQTTALLLEQLNRIDPQQSDCLAHVSDKPGWKFSWAGETMFLTAFGVCYPQNHPRNPYGFDYTYFFFQPDFVLRAHPGLAEGKEEISRARILKAFNKVGMHYDNTGKEAEHARYVRPMQPDDPPVAWWNYLSSYRPAQKQSA